MSMRELSERLKNWRCERPDEWVMDEFIKLASAMEYRSERAEEELAALRAQRDELESRLAEIEAQEPVAVFKGAHDGRFVIDFLHGYIPPVHIALYTGPVAKQTVNDYCPSCACTSCEQEKRSKAE